MSAKILLIRTGSDVFHAKAYVAVEAGLYAREIQSLTDLELALKAEQFDLVIHDGSKLGKEPLSLSETIRGYQRTAPILLLCAKPEMEVIVRAIRLGVRDLFHPPLNLGAFFARVGELLQPKLTTSAEAVAQHCRHEITLFLAGESAQKSISSSEQASGAAANSSASSASQKNLSSNGDERQKALADAEDKLAQSHKSLLEKEKVIFALQAELEIASTSIKQEQSRIKSQLIQLEEERKVFEAERASFNEAVHKAEQLSVKNSKAEEALALTARKLADLEVSSNESVKAREAELSAREAVANTLAQREADLSAAEAEFEAKTKALTADIAKLQKDTENLSSERLALLKLKADLAESSKLIAIREDELAERLVQVQISEQKNAQYGAKLEALSKTLDERDKRLDARVAAVGEIEKQLNAQKKFMDAELARIEAEAAGVEEAGHEIVSREKKLLQEQEQLAALKAQFEAGLASHASERKKLVKELAELEQQKVAFSVEREAFDAEIQQLKAREKAFEEKKKKLLEAM